MDLIRRVTDQEEIEKLKKEQDDAMKMATELIQERPGPSPVSLIERVVPKQTEVKKTPDNMEYLILFVGYYILDEEEETLSENISREWVYVIGRQEAYRAIIEMMDEMSIDFIESKIIPETRTPKEAKCLYKYMEYIIENNLVQLDQNELYPELSELLEGYTDEELNFEDGM